MPALFTSSLRSGLRVTRRRPGLAALVYALNLVPALVLAVPIYAAVQEAVGGRGYGPELARGFDAVLWADLWETVGVAVQGLAAQLVWLVPVLLVWKALVGVGLVHATRDGGARSFWTGVGRYGRRAVGVGLAFAVLTVVWLVLVGLAALVAGLIWTGEVAVFWTQFVAVPTVLVSGLSVLDLMHDYARCAVVMDEQRVLRAVRTGLAWPFRHGAASRLYVAWFAAGLGLWLLPFWLDAQFVAATGLAVWGLFLLNQLVLLARAAVTVGWIGSETALYETVRLRARPPIADEAVGVVA